MDFDYFLSMWNSWNLLWIRICSTPNCLHLARLVIMILSTEKHAAMVDVCVSCVYLNELTLYHLHTCCKLLWLKLNLFTMSHQEGTLQSFAPCIPDLLNKTLWGKKDSCSSFVSNLINSDLGNAQSTPKSEAFVAMERNVIYTKHTMVVKLIWFLGRVGKNEIIYCAVVSDCCFYLNVHTSFFALIFIHYWILNAIVLLFRIWGLCNYSTLTLLINEASVLSLMVKVSFQRLRCSIQIATAALRECWPIRSALRQQTFNQNAANLSGQWQQIPWHYSEGLDSLHYCDQYHPSNNITKAIYLIIITLGVLFRAFQLVITMETAWKNI